VVGWIGYDQYLEDTEKHVGSDVVHPIIDSHVCMSVQVAYCSALEPIDFEHAISTVVRSKSEH
jgi:flagellar biosynthesis/type III secretory pathway ATPase